MRDLKPAFGPATMGHVSHDSATGGHHDQSLTRSQRLGLTLGALACLLLSGCGMSQLERHTTAAGALHAATGVAADVIEARAQADADAAVAPCASAAAPRETCAAALEEAMRPHRRAEAAQHLVAAAVDVYVAEVLAMALAEATGEPDDTRARAALSHALSLYRALVDLLAAYGVELPGVARVLAVVGGAL